MATSTNINGVYLVYRRRWFELMFDTTRMLANMVLSEAKTPERGCRPPSSILRLTITNEGTIEPCLNSSDDFAFQATLSPRDHCLQIDP
jgi:hypothetical protein